MAIPRVRFGGPAYHNGARAGGVLARHCVGSVNVEEGTYLSALQRVFWSAEDSHAVLFANCGWRGHHTYQRPVVAWIPADSRSSIFGKAIEADRHNCYFPLGLGDSLHAITGCRSGFWRTKGRVGWVKARYGPVPGGCRFSWKDLLCFVLTCLRRSRNNLSTTTVTVLHIQLQCQSTSMTMRVMSSCWRAVRGCHWRSSVRS